MGGSITFILAWEHPEIFGLAAPFSPAIKIGRFNYLRNVMGYSGPKKDIKFYFYNGGLNMEAEIQPGLDETISFLTKAGYEKGKDFKVVNDSTLDHNEAAWAKYVPDALQFLFPSK